MCIQPNAHTHCKPRKRPFLNHLRKKKRKEKSEPSPPHSSEKKKEDNAAAQHG